MFTTLEKLHLFASRRLTAAVRGADQFGDGNIIKTHIRRHSFYS